MSRFEPKTFTFIRDRLLERVVARTELTDIEEGGQVHTICVGVARELDGLNFEASNLKRTWSIDDATGVDLDERAVQYDSSGTLRRVRLAKAISGVVFGRTGTSGTVSISAGAIVRVPGGGPEYRTTAGGQILNGFSVSAQVPVEALIGGSSGNVDAGTITQFNAITGVETVTNPIVASGGFDEQSDESFREQIRAWLRRLARGTPTALRGAVLGLSLEGFGAITFAQVIQLQGESLGISYVYVDNGLGTVETTELITNQVVLASALGGEQRLFLPNVPVKISQPATIKRNGVALVSEVDYWLNPATGQIEFTRDSFPTGLTAVDQITASYTAYTGLIAFAQHVLNGDEGDPETYPGYIAAGTLVQVLSPLILQAEVRMVLTLLPTFESQRADIVIAVRAAINRYINSLGIGADVILTELTAAALTVPGVYDVILTTPTTNIVVGDGELVRATDSNLIIE